jgi:hypothetical protein
VELQQQALWDHLELALVLEQKDQQAAQQFLLVLRAVVVDMRRLLVTAVALAMLE